MSLKSRLRGSVNFVVGKLIGDTLEAALSRALDDDACNMRRHLRRQAAIESATWVEENIELHRHRPNQPALMDSCLSEASPEGLILEFGVYRGNSIRHIARRIAPRRVFGFDSFEGLDEAWQFLPSGFFSDVASEKGGLPSVPDNVTLVKGRFQDSLPGFLAGHPDPVALVHIDSDLYSSAKYVLETLTPRIIPGTIMVFDELINYPGWKTGEFRALHEWKQMTRAELGYLGYISRPTEERAGQVGLKILSVG